MRIAKEGWIFILPSAALTALFWVAEWWPLTILFLLLAAAFGFFFRDPRRTIPPDESLILSPADGKVLAVDSLSENSDLSGPVTRITIFLSILDVHLVRAPLTAVVRRNEYRPGKFLRADRAEAGAVNESRTLLLRTKTIDLVLKMIVGVAARRIKCFVNEDDSIVRGQKVGLMYFGSRVELYLPAGVPVKAEPGGKVKAGQSVIAKVTP